MRSFATENNAAARIAEAIGATKAIFIECGDPIRAETVMALLTEEFEIDRPDHKAKLINLVTSVNRCQCSYSTELVEETGNRRGVGSVPGQHGKQLIFMIVPSKAEIEHWDGDFVIKNDVLRAAGNVLYKEQLALDYSGAYISRMIWLTTAIVAWVTAVVVTASSIGNVKLSFGFYAGLTSSYVLLRQGENAKWPRSQRIGFYVAGLILLFEVMILLSSIFKHHS